MAALAGADVAATTGIATATSVTVLAPGGPVSYVALALAAAAAAHDNPRSSPWTSSFLQQIPLAKTFSQSPKQRSPPPPPPSFLARLNESWYSCPQLFRFCVSGSLANLLFLWIEKNLFSILSEAPPGQFPAWVHDNATTVSYTTAYLLQIVTTHALNALLVYGLDTVSTLSKYWATLRGQFCAYSVGMVLSVMLFSYLTSSSSSSPPGLNLDRHVALWTTTAIVAGINYMVIGKIMQSTSVGNGADGSSHQTANDNEKSYNKKSSTKKIQAWWKTK